MATSSVNISADLPTATTAGTTEIGLKAEFSGMVPFRIIEQVALAGGASGSPADFTQKLPANAVVAGYRIKAVGAHTNDTATHVSIGNDSDPDAYAEIAVGSLDADNETVAGLSDSASAAAIGTADTLRLTATNGSGAAAGTHTGTYDVALWGFIFQDFPN
jgi:hypothetical protein